MVNKRLFGFAGKAKPADVMNEAGGKAYAFSPEHALAQYAVTGTMHNTFYATAEEQLDTILALADACSPEFVAKTAIYCREKGFMKDVPALLVAYLSKRDVALMKIAFARVIDNGKMLRNFVKIVRSGRVGRKSFGSAPKRMAQAWFAKRSPETIFKGSIGSDPSMSDVIKMIRPAPKDEKGEKDVVREALYGYLIGKLVERDKLPKVVQELEAFKASPDTAPLPNVPFEMLTALDLTTKHWIAIAKNMTWTQTRMNLNTLLRKGVLEDVASIELVAKRLSDAEAIRRARALPYQLLAVPIARLMGPEAGVFASLMGPPDRQGHGTTRPGGRPVFARVMGPANRQAHGATRPGAGLTRSRRPRARQGAARRRCGAPSGGADELSGVEHDRCSRSSPPLAGGAGRASDRARERHGP